MIKFKNKDNQLTQRSTIAIHTGSPSNQKLQYSFSVYQHFFCRPVKQNRDSAKNENKLTEE